jgi:8-oxo-dGTP pyrophosphatase MutT (NUDIX family)
MKTLANGALALAHSFPMANEPARPVDAASLLLLRDSEQGRGVQIYMVRRHPRSRFLANALVFVGGRHDEADRAEELLSRCTGLDAAEAARRMDLEDPRRALGLYVTAIRECFEEAGVLVAHDEDRQPPEQHRSDLPARRERLIAEELSFERLLEELDLSLPLDSLHYLDHWLTPEFEPRRYDTRFFACRAPAGQQASFDPKETSFGGWLGLGEVLEANREGRYFLAPPTLTILEGIQGCETVEEVLRAAPDRPIPVFMPRPLLGTPPPEHPTLLFPGDHRYDDPGSAEGPEHYVRLRDARWERIDTRG